MDNMLKEIVLYEGFADDKHTEIAKIILKRDLDSRFEFEWMVKLLGCYPEICGSVVNIPNDLVVREDYTGIANIINDACCINNIVHESDVKRAFNCFKVN